MTRTTRRSTQSARFVAAVLLVASGFASASGQDLHPEFAPLSGSSVRAALLYPASLAPHASNTIEDNSGRDPWMAFDKVEHVAFGFFVTLGTQYILVSKFDAGEHAALPLSIGVAASAGLSKELYDRHYGSGFFSTRDLAADAAGILIAAGLILL